MTLPTEIPLGYGDYLELPRRCSFREPPDAERAEPHGFVYSRTWLDDEWRSYLLRTYRCMLP